MSDLSEFVILDQLIQLIYLGPSRFVLLSSLDSSQKHWSVHLGLAGAEGRWWSAKWDISDVIQCTGSKLSEEELELFAETVKGAIVQGNIQLEGWTAGLKRSEGNLHLAFAGKSRKLVRMPLAELSAESAAAQATSAFISIALQAKDKGCELYPTSYALPTLAPLPSTATHTAPRPQSVRYLTSSTGVRKPVSSRSDASNARTDKPVTMEQRPVNASRAPSRSPAKQAVPKPINSVAAKRPPKGASLANPNKKARKYQELEFEDD